MARRTNAKPGDAAPPAGGTTPAPESPTIDPRVAELEAALAAAHASYEEQIVDLKLLADQARAEFVRQLGEQSARFDAAWRKREEEIVAMKIIAAPAPAPAALPETAPVMGRVLVATCLLHAHRRDGSKVSIPAHHPIPDDVDPSTLDAGTYAEKGA